MADKKFKNPTKGFTFRYFNDSGKTWMEIEDSWVDMDKVIGIETEGMEYILHLSSGATVSFKSKFSLEQILVSINTRLRRK